jgi:DNA repair protein RadD
MSLFALQRQQLLALPCESALDHPVNLRSYQLNAVNDVRRLWSHGIRRVCLVAPTGAGKTVLGQALSQPFRSTLWITHRRELVRQTAARLSIRCRVVTIQRLLGSGARPHAELVIVDEAHHLPADKWSAIAHHYDKIPLLGLTATPERADGRPLGDLFDEMVVAAHYSQLLADGHLVQCRTFRSPRLLESGEIARNPVIAYQECGGGQQGFVYVSRVDVGYRLAQAFHREGISADVIECKTPKRRRDSTVASFARGQTRLLINVATLTEGVDVPAASVCILARRCMHASTYLQMAGRVLRPHPGKQIATLLDLTGVTHMHGLPGEDRLYSLHGTAIRRENDTRDCPRCRVVLATHVAVCPECGHRLQHGKRREECGERPDIHFYSLALQEVYAGGATPTPAKDAEWSRLLRVCERRGYSVSWALKEYRLLFPEETPAFSASVRQWEHRRLQRIAAAKGYRSAWIGYRYKELFGDWP